MTVASVYAIFADSEEAERIALIVVEEGLAACANILGTVRSVYRWQGKVETSDEIASLFKTSHDRTDALIARISELHSYDVPCVASWPVAKILASYGDWVEESLR